MAALRSKKSSLRAVYLDPKLKKAVWSDTGEVIKKLEHGYKHDCTECYGFGVWPGETIPVSFAEAEDGFASEECPVCGEDNAVFEFLASKREAALSNSSSSGDLIPKRDIGEAIASLEKLLRCAELSAIQEVNINRHEW